MKKKILSPSIGIMLATAISLSAAVGTASARTWTDAASGRTIEGDYVESDATHVSIKSGGKTQKIAIARLAEADRTFIGEQIAEVTSPTGGLKTVITPPVSIKPMPVKGQGDKRSAGLEVTNTSDKAISRLDVEMVFFGENGEVKESFSNTSDGSFNEQKEKLGAGKNYVIELSNFWIKDDIMAVAGRAMSVTWEDGTKWPAWTGPAPSQQGDSPVSLVIKGIMGEGDQAIPLIEGFNHSDREVTRFMYQITYLDGERKELSKGRRTGRGGIGAGKGITFFGSEAPPEGTEDVTLSVLEVTFGDDPGVAMHSDLTAEQIGGRTKVDGGSWKVSFAEKRYLGFMVTETKPGGEPSMKFHWSSEPSLSHDFHYDHHIDGDDHELTFSPVRGKGDPSASSITSRFSDPKGGHRQQSSNVDMEFKPAGPRVGESLRGPNTLYSLKSIGRKTVFELKVVFVEDTAAAEEALRKVYGSR